MSIIDHDDLTQEVFRRLRMFGSHNRAEPLLRELQALKSPEAFWSVMQDNWTSCDDTWWLRSKFLRLLGSRGVIPAHLMTPENRTFYDSLPNRIEIYRGCSKSRAKGLSWTTDKAIALGFAQGHRQITVPSPVLCRAVVRKDRGFFFFATDDRGEKEIVVDTRMPGLRIEMTALKLLSPR